MYRTPRTDLRPLVNVRLRLCIASAGFVFALFAGCPGDPETEEPEPLPVNDTLNPYSDDDGDGLLNIEEEQGWYSTINGIAAPTDAHFVSDPRRKDSDGDGLTDLEERIAGTDALADDTDLDTLTDFDEVKRWGTNPVAVDTDGDATPPGGGPKDLRLLDGAELRLQEDPERPGLMIAGGLATSPLLYDTDGDTLSDFAEIRDANRNPVIAEVPELRVALTPDSALGIFLDVVDTVTNEKVEELSHEDALNRSSSLTESLEVATEMAAWIRGYVESVTKAEAGISFSTLGASVTQEAKAGFAFGGSVKATTSYDMDVTNGVTRREFAELVETETRTETRAISGGIMVASVDLTNTSALPFSVRHLSINATYRLGKFTRPLATLRPKNAELAYTLEPGETVTVILEDSDIDGGRTLQFLQGAASVQLSGVTYDIVDEELASYDFLLQAVGSQGATVQLDFGNGTTRTEFIAANIRRGPSGAPLGIAVTDALEILDIDYDRHPSLPRAFRIGEYPTELWPEAQPPPDFDALGLDAPGYVFTDGPGDRQVRVGWLAVRSRGEDVEDVGEDLSNIRALPSDLLRLIRSGDEDRDGLSQFEESLAGTRDDMIDTDGDGLSDFWEFSEGWVVNVQGVPPERVYSLGAQVDSDFDGLTDVEEMQLGLHPTRPDTDFDGILDATDPKPLIFNDLRLPSYYADLFDCTAQGCVNADPDSGDNYFELFWTYPEPLDAAFPTVDEVLILRETIPLAEEANIPPFNGSVVTGAGELAAANLEPQISVVYRGAGNSHTDVFLQGESHHIYHFYSVYTNAVGERAYIYSGADGDLFTPNYPDVPLVKVVQFGFSYFAFSNFADNDPLAPIWALTASLDVGSGNAPVPYNDLQYARWNLDAAEGAALGWTYDPPGQIPQQVPELGGDFLTGMIFCIPPGGSFTIDGNVLEDGPNGGSSWLFSFGHTYDQLPASGTQNYSHNPAGVFIAPGYEDGNPTLVVQYELKSLGAFNEIEALERCQFPFSL